VPRKKKAPDPAAPAASEAPSPRTTTGTSPSTSTSRRPGTSPDPISASLLTDLDLHLFHEGSHFHLQDKLGAHPVVRDGVEGCAFAVFAPNAERVSVIGEFNAWDKQSHPLARRDTGGVWEGFVPGIGRGAVYKYHLVSMHRGYRVDKADPFAFAAEKPPKTASVVEVPDFEWTDAEWMASRGSKQKPGSPLSIYEVHLGSWRRGAGGRMLGYR